MRLTWIRSLTGDPGPVATVVLDATSDEPKGPDEVLRFPIGPHA